MMAPTWEIAARREQRYAIIETHDLFDPDNETLWLGGPRGRRLVLVDETVLALHGSTIRRFFATHGLEHQLVAVPAGEANKRLDVFVQVTEAFDRFRLARRCEPVIAVGGGVVLDIVSFVASCYRRGVPCVRVPTTLMAYVDAAIGIKTGLNFGSGKNRIGSFAPPHACVLDRRFLATLPRRHLVNGVGEIFKLALIKDRELFTLLEREGVAAIDDRFQQRGEQLLRRSITGMLDELRDNLYEDDLERRVDYGHTFSTALEMAAPDLLHGEAVAIDCVLAAVLAERRGLLTRPALERILRLARALGLDTDHPRLDAELAWGAVVERTAHRDGRQRLPLPRGIGDAVFVNDVTPGEVEAGLASLRGARPLAASPRLAAAMPSREERHV